MKILTMLSLITTTTLFIGCGGGSSSGSGNNGNGGESSKIYSKFLAFYTPSVDSESKSLKLLSRNPDNGLTSETIDSTIYPPQEYGGWYNFIGNANAYGNLYVMTLHKDISPTKYNDGVVGYLDSKKYEYLPLVDPGSKYKYKSYKPGTGKVTPNGYVIYMAKTGDIGYSDADESFLMRYNTQTKEHDVAKSCDGFILDQPEKGSDTEACVMGGNLFPSVDGRYVFGDASGIGVDAGVLHWDYKILFQYDFKEHKYTRLGEKDDSNVGFIGTTSDGKNIVYRSGENLNTKVLNIDTGAIKNLKNVTLAHLGGQSPSQWNKNGALAASTVALYYEDLVNDQEIVVVPKDVDNAQFSEDGNSIYFRFDGDSERKLYKTKDLSENSPYEEVGVVPKEYGDILLVRGNNSSSNSGSNSSSNNETSTSSSSSNSSVPDEGSTSSNSSLKSCLEDEGMDGEVYWTTCYNLFPQSECSNSGLGQAADHNYTQSYRVVDGACLDNGFVSDDYFVDVEYQGQTYQTYFKFSE